MDISKLNLSQLENLKTNVEKHISDFKYKICIKKHTKEEIIKMFTQFGYNVPKGVKIYKIPFQFDVKKNGGYGMKVGEYEHSCIIDSTHFAVLLVVNGYESYVESFPSTWLSDSIIV